MTHSHQGTDEYTKLPPLNWRQYLSFSTDHKTIGVQYLLVTFFFFLVGGLMAMLIRAELLTPQLNLVSRPLYNGLFTLHGTIMIFLWVIPAQVGLANYLVPLMIGAKDMAFPKLNAIAFWIIPPAGLLLLSSLFIPAGSAQAGWWSYPPVSTQVPLGVVVNGQSIWLISIFLLGVSSILGAVNFLSTIVWMRAPGMTFFRIQHLFWFYSHPAVYVMALPAFGIFSEIIPAFTRNPLFGYRSVAIASIGIAVLSGKKVANNPWHATGLEWSVSSPPPPENFSEVPVVTLPPYSYGDPQYAIRDADRS